MLRILYFGFKPKAMETYSSFDSYLSWMKAKFGLQALASLTLTEALSMVPDGEPVVLGIDEFNYLLQNNFEVDDRRHISVLRAVVVSLGNVMVSATTRFFPTLAGTAMEPLSFAIAESSHLYVPIPLDLLKADDLMLIASALEWLPREWKTCDAFRRSLSAMGGLPRLVEFFLEECKKQVDLQHQMRHWPWIQMMQNVRHRAQRHYTVSRQDYSHALLVVAILGRSVQRNEHILGSREYLGKMTYGELERIGRVVLVQRDNGLFVELPFLLLYEMVSSVTSPLKGETNELRLLWNEVETMLSQLFKPRDDGLFSLMEWKSFRILFGHI